MPWQEQDGAVRTETSKITFFEDLLDVGIPGLIWPSGVRQAVNALSCQK